MRGDFGFGSKKVMLWPRKVAIPWALPAGWRRFSMFNPIVYLISGFRWSFFGSADVAVGMSLAMTLGFLAICLGLAAWIFRTGYRLKS